MPEAWHGFRPERLAAILEAIVDAGVPDNGLASGFLMFVRGGDAGRFEQHDRRTAAQDGASAHAGAGAGAPADAPAASAPASSDVGTPPDTTTEMPAVMKLAQAIDLRMRGSVTEALALLDSIGAVAPLQPVFDARGGWDLMITVQHGITAILAGQFDRALTIFTGARFQASFASLVCLSRDALVKSALLHAAFGDQREARIVLDHAASLPRSISWIEPRIDVTAMLAESMLDTTPPDLALETVHSLPLADVGEMWPFYAIALHRAHVRAGRVQDLSARIAMLEGIPFPYVPGKGFSGSVLPLIRANRALEQGDARSAAWFAAAADQEFIGTRLVLMRIEARGNRPQRALRTAARTADHLGSGAMRRLDLWRSASIVEALLALDREDEALLVLRASASIAGGLSESERELFPVEVRRFGSVHLPAASASPSASATPDLPDLPVLPAPPAPPAYLTPREREVVEMLATDLSRADIAAALYISINTLKKHLRVVYDKLDVTRRDAAVLRARHEGWIGPAAPGTQHPRSHSAS
ncbi:LuxR C-terminal-related transcriptional regulator [Plantibacter sp. Mn2098]|uniref:helix-turn-helix transcriptional regulator n=1 Tax=Plantibacter sp. Mn2098 TaxID=3395266 RepID=UPI003BEE6403